MTFNLFRPDARLSSLVFTFSSTRTIYQKSAVVRTFRCLVKFAFSSHFCDLRRPFAVDLSLLMLDGSSSPEMHPSSEVVNFFGMFRSTPKKHSFLESTGSRLGFTRLRVCCYRRTFLVFFILYLRGFIYYLFSRRFRRWLWRGKGFLLKRNGVTSENNERTEWCRRAELSNCGEERQI